MSELTALPRTWHIVANRQMNIFSLLSPQLARNILYPIAWHVNITMSSHGLRNYD